ncbi:MAG: hypothetical protein JWQ35_2767 [Bacteriovoracaceae bacterium]|nr:hypothetical protein [Bacteriovoracaceae bacterium]
MDIEAELIRAENWPELKRYYASKTGHSWELGWVNFLQKDLEKSVEHFSKALNDPRYEEAAHILLWKLGRRPYMRPLEGPPSLRLYDAFTAGRAGPLLAFLQESHSNRVYLPFIFQSIVEKMTLTELATLETFERPAAFSLLLAEVFDRKWKNYEKAKFFYDEFFSDPWTKKVLEENRRQIFDNETSRRIRMAYAQKDGAHLKIALAAALARSSKLSSNWMKAMEAAIAWDTTHLTQNILGYAFWRESELSPRALQIMREVLFSKEEIPVPPFVKFWAEFFASPHLIPIPNDLDPNSLSLWQLRVEMNKDLLSEALLRFPQEERFLFLWSLRQREKSSEDPRKWPAEEKESNVVRKSLEKAFERSSNKILWFDRLRASGCSQDFYEYAVQRAAVPILWVLEDLDKNFLSNSQTIRSYLRDQLSLTAPSDSDSHLLKPKEFLKTISFLTPSEKQQVLLSRFVLAEIPEEILNEEFMDLFYEARSRVSAEAFEKWQNVVLDHLSMKSQRTLSPKDWRWIELGWEKNSFELERFAPELGLGLEFPWEPYLEKLRAHGFSDLLMMALSQIPDERLKESWIVTLLAESTDYRIYKAITTLKTEHIRFGLLAHWHERKNEIEKALEQRELELSASPILNDQIRISKQMIELLKKLSPEVLKSESSLNESYRVLEATGGLDEFTCRDLAELFSKTGQFDKAFNVTVNQWSRSSLVLKESLLPTLLERAFQARTVDATQRLLVDFVFEQGTSGPLTYEILHVLLDGASVFKIRHLRREFIDRASQLFPLHCEVLKARAAYDYRALLLWKSFYGDPIEQQANPTSHERKRKYELWELTESVSHVEAAAVFSKYLITLSRVSQKKTEDKSHEFFEKAKRLSQRLSKLYGIRKPFEISLSENLTNPLEISFKPKGIELKKSFFDELDEEMWAGITVGLLQIFDDYDKGLFDERHLMERFFQGMLLSGTPIAKLIRLWVWLAMSEGLIEPTLLQSDPETLIEKLPLINSLLIFYLGSDFSEKMDACALSIS